MRPTTTHLFVAAGLSASLLFGLAACADPAREDAAEDDGARATRDGGTDSGSDTGAEAGRAEAGLDDPGAATAMPTPTAPPSTTLPSASSSSSDAILFFDAPTPEGAAAGAASAGVTPCGPGVFCATSRIPNKHACIIASRLRYDDYREDYITGCRSAYRFRSSSWSPLPVEVFNVGINDMESPMVAVVTRPEGGSWVLPLFNLEVSVAGDETIEHLYVRASETDGHLRFEATMHSKSTFGSCTEESPYWVTESADAIYCGDDGGEVVCTGRVPLSRLALEIEIDSDGFEIGRKRQAYYGFETEWRGTNLRFTRRFGRFPRNHRALLGTHSIDDARRTLIRARYDR